jgi:hypothetical protein
MYFYIIIIIIVIIIIIAAAAVLRFMLLRPWNPLYHVWHCSWFGLLWFWRLQKGNSDFTLFSVRIVRYPRELFKYCILCVCFICALFIVLCFIRVSVLCCCFNWPLCCWFSMPVHKNWRELNYHNNFKIGGLCLEPGTIWHPPHTGPPFYSPLFSALTDTVALGLLARRHSGRVVKLITGLQVTTRLRMCKAVPSLPPPPPTS